MVFVVWVGFPAYLLGDLLVFQSITGHLEEDHDLLHDRSDLHRQARETPRGFLGGISADIISLPRRSPFKPALFNSFLAFSMTHLQNPVNPDGAVARLKSLYASEIWKREKNKHARECCFKFRCDSMTYVWPRKCTRYNEVQGNNRIIVFLSRSFTVFNKLLYLISVFLYSLKLWQILSDIQSRQNRPYLSLYV